MESTRDKKLYILIKTLVLLSHRVLSQETASQNPITINTYGSCTSDDDAMKRLADLERLVLQQQQLVMAMVDDADSANSVLIRDCSEAFENGNRSDGIYTVRPENSKPFPTYCQYDVQGLWTVIQRRVDGTVDFHRSWTEYKQGFGVQSHNFYLGNEKIHAITSQRQMALRIEIRDWEGDMRHADYKFFHLDGEGDDYAIHYTGYSGTAGDSLGDFHRGMPFSTFDKDNDETKEDCADAHGGGWWFKDCDHANLNGYYNHDSRLSGSSDGGIEWDEWEKLYSFKETVMKIKPAFPN